MLKSELLRALKAEISRHDFATFLDAASHDSGGNVLALAELVEHLPASALLAVSQDSAL